jgi:hypothetical protein
MLYDDVGNHPNFVALRIGLMEHPDLFDLCAEQPDFESVIAEIAAYCNILLDGAYTRDEVIKLVGILAGKLNDKNVLIIPVGFNSEKVVDNVKDEDHASTAQPREISAETIDGLEGSANCGAFSQSTGSQSEDSGASDGSILPERASS